jgi:CubicO group peptidase (beta-lactamase class C family)
MRAARLGLSAFLAFGLTHGAAAAPAALPAQPPGVAWPSAAWPEGAPAVADATALSEAAARLFETTGRAGVPDTRALLAVQGGRVVLERYAEGFGPDSRFRSWSMAKSLLQALVAVLVRDGRLALDAPAPVPEWRADGDPRGALTLRHLLQMTSGLDNEDGGTEPGSFVARLLFGDLSGDTASAAASVPLRHAPGSFWAYSTATSQIVSGIVAREIGGGREGVRDFLAREIAGPLGARSLMLEFDAAGTPLGGGYAWGSARDWARLGALYLRDGVWEGRRILPAGWVDFSRTLAPAPNNGTYGAHFWVNGTPAPGQQFQPLRSGIDAFEMAGNAGQFVVIVPDRDLVIVRLGEMQRTSWQQLSEGLSDVVERFPRSDASAEP